MSGSQQLLLGSGQGAAPAVDPYFYSVTSLLHGDGVNGGQNNTFLDSSTNNFTITRNGNTTQGSFSPFSQTGWSNYFDGTGDYLTAPSNAAFNIGTGDYTFECWVYKQTSSRVMLVAIASAGLSISISASGNIEVNRSLIAIDFTFTAGVPNNQWTHIAVARSGTSLQAFMNGTSLGTQTSSTSYGQGTCFVGIDADGSSTPYLGYISNFRLVKGTAVYTSNFTPSLTPLTAISGTSLLTCQANRFLDASSNAFAITRNGDVSVQPFSPFNPTTPYSTSSIGGSGYFDGSGDYLSLADNAAFNMGTGNFTAEFWLYTADQTNSYPGIISASVFSDTGAISVRYDNTGNANKIFIYLAGASPSDPLVTSSAYAFGQWIHVAIVRDSTTALKIYVNGTLDGTGTITSGQVVDFSGANSFYIGRGFDVDGGAAYLAGYISSVRLVKGTAVYTGNFTPPTAPLTAITNTSLLCNFTNGAIFDNAAVADYETVGNAQISTSVKKYGTGSMAFDGSGDNLFAPSNIAYTFGSGDFTIEFWLYLNSVVSTQVIYDNRSANGAYPAIYMNSASIRYYVNTADRIIGPDLSVSVWYHIAVSRVAGQTKMFVNGTQVGSTYADSTVYLQAPLRIGNDFLSGSYLNGYVDDLRVTKGIGRYPYNFTPPTAEFPNIGGTVTLTADPYFDYTTLLLPGNGTNGAQNNTFLDSSTNAFSITRNGNTTQGTFSPFSQTGWGNYFDGTGDTLSLADDNALDLGTGDFSIEGWVYLTGFPGSGANAFISKFASGNYAYLVQIISASTLRFYTGNSGSLSSYYDYTYTWVLNQWTHIAITRESGTLRAFVNGTLLGSNASVTQNLTNTSTLILGNNGDGGGQDFNGYMSNVRIVKGTAVYTSNFTPSTTPLTAISGTSLLTCQSNRFIDNSSNAFAITRNGDVSVQAFSPFNPTAAWSASTNGGSGYFDGSGDSLYAAANAAFNFGAPSGNTNDFTVEMWVYPLNFSNIYFLYGTGPSSGSDQFYLNTDGKAYYFDGASQISSPVLTANSWNHLALVRNGSGSNNIRVYGNGVSGTAVTSSTSLGSSVNSPYIGSRSDGSYPLPGYISSLRVVKGTAVYTANFTPPTAPLTAITNTSLLLNFTNAGIYDATSKNDLETVGNAQISTTQSKFGGSSMYFDGTGDYLLPSGAASNNLLALGSGDFTIEFWVRYAALGDVTLIDWRPSSTNGAYPTMFNDVGTNKLIYYTNSATRITSSTVFATNTWYHVAIARYSGSTKMYINGINEGSAYSDSNNYLSAALRPVIGANGFSTGSVAVNAYLQDLRITKGIARYTSNFTPPTTAFLTL